MRKLSYLLLIGLLTISLSVLGQEAKNNNAFSVSIKDFGGAIYELENNYAGFPILADNPIKYKEYSELKIKLYNKKFFQTRIS